MDTQNVTGETEVQRAQRELREAEERAAAARRHAQEQERLARERLQEEKERARVAPLIERARAAFKAVAETLEAAGVVCKYLETGNDRWRPEWPSVVVEGYGALCVREDADRVTSFRSSPRGRLVVRVDGWGRGNPTRRFQEGKNGLNVGGIAAAVMAYIRQRSIATERAQAQRVADRLAAEALLAAEQMAKRVRAAFPDCGVVRVVGGSAGVTLTAPDLDEATATRVLVAMLSAMGTEAGLVEEDPTRDAADLEKRVRRHGDEQ